MFGVVLYLCGGEVFAPGLNYLLEEENLLWLFSFMAPRLLLLS